MFAEIITIGDEILIGQIVDTNSAWIAAELNLLGFSVKQISSVSDDMTHIIKALDEARNRAKLIIITGGLGPTADDVTKPALCKYFNTSLVYNEKVFEDIQKLFAERGREVTQTNRKQAEVPAACKPIRNQNGTAPGMWFQVEDTVFISLPGVPFEMKHMMTDDVVPMLKKHFKTPGILHRTILTQGIGESMLSDMISNWEKALPPHLKLAYLPSVSMVRLRLSGSHPDKELLDRSFHEQFKLLDEQVKDYSFGYDDDTLEKVIGELLMKENATVATAESCTGGQIASLITRIPGSSAYFKGSIVSYTEQVKTNLLGIPQDLIKNDGVVSESVASKMAEAVLNRLDADYAIATTGVAGPSGATALNPVGTVWISVASHKKTVTKKFLLGNNRERVIMAASLTGISMLRKFILKWENQ